MLLQPPTSVTREDSPPTFRVPRSLSSFSLRPSRRPAMLARSRSVSMSLRPSSTRTASTTLSKSYLIISVAHMRFADVQYHSFKNPKSDSSKWLTGKELAEVYDGYTKKYDLVSIEDPFDQDDWEAWSHLTASSPIQIVGGEQWEMQHARGLD